MLSCFTVIGSISSTTQKFVNDVRAQAIGHFIFWLEKIENMCWRFKNNSNFIKKKFLLILFFKPVLKWSHNLRRNNKTITKSFFSAVNVTGFSVSLLLRKFLMQLSINLIENAFFYDIPFNWHNPIKSWKIRNIRISKAKIKPTLYSSEIKLLKFEYTPLNKGFWYIDVLKPFLVLVIKTSKKGTELLCSFSQVNLMFLCLIIFEFLKMIRWTKQNKYVIDISSVVYRFELIKTLIKPNLFMET